MKIFFQFIWTCVSFINIFTAAQHDLDPFLLEVDVNSPQLLKLPSTNIPSWNDPNVLAACPAEIAEKIILKPISRKTEFCLFQKIFQEGETVACTQKIKPMLRGQYDDINYNLIKCGPSEHYMFEVGFYYCGTHDVIQQLSDSEKLKNPSKYITPRFFPIYELCVDTDLTIASWLKYSVMTPAIFQDEKNKQKVLEETAERDPVEINTNAMLYIREQYFTDMKNSYETQSEGKTTMKATFMVPMEHIALRMWRNATNHIINTAPFSSQRMKLVTGINDGIKKIAFNLHSNNQRLSIYTAVRKFSNIGAGSVWGGSMQEPNVWYKLLYEEKEKLAAMVVIHNDESKGTLKKKACQIPVKCETMENWYEKRGEDDVDKIPQDDLTFAYCCDPKTPEIETIFNIYLEITGSLDLDEYFKKEENDNSKYPPSAALRQLDDEINT